MLGFFLLRYVVSFSLHSIVYTGAFLEDRDACKTKIMGYTDKDLIKLIKKKTFSVTLFQCIS